MSAQLPLLDLPPDPSRDYREIGLRHWVLAERGAYDPLGRALADQHYSRRKVGSPQFMAPGQRFVLIGRDFNAVWGWRRPHPDSGIKSMNGLDGWTCSIFRRESGPMASELVLDAELAIAAEGHGCGPDGLLTYVSGKDVASPNPGYCYQCAGWVKVGWCAKRKKRLLWKPFHLAGIAACGVERPTTLPAATSGRTRDARGGR